MKLIQTVTITTSQTQIDLTSIPQTFTDLIILGAWRDSTATTNGYIRLNNDTAANYRMQRMTASGSSTGGADVTGATAFFNSQQNTSSAFTANTFTNTKIVIPNYTGSNPKVVWVESVTENNATNAGLSFAAGVYSLTGAITAVNILGNNGTNLVAGSTISLYGVTSGSDGIATTSP